MREVRQRNVALILAREMALNLATPIWVWDEEEILVFMNEPAEAIVGRPYQDMGTLRLDELPQFQPEELDGTPVPPAELPSAIALREHRPSHKVVRITGLDGEKRVIGVTAFPLFARANEFVGAMAVFWPQDDETSA